MLLKFIHICEEINCLCVVVHVGEQARVKAVYECHVMLTDGRVLGDGRSSVFLITKNVQNPSNKRGNVILSGCNYMTEDEL